MSTQYGHRLLVATLEEKAHSHPEQVFCLLPRSSNLQDGFYEVNYKQVQTAVDYTAQWLKTKFGQFSPNETVSYMGLPDIRYNIIFYAAVRIRLKVFLPSPRNSSVTNLSLLEQTQCTKLCYSPESPDIAASAQALQKASKTLQVLEFPSLDELLKAQCASVPYSVNFDQVRQEPIVILHSSGSTGIPKPVTMTNGSLAVIDNDRNFPTVPGRQNHDLTTWDFPPGSYLYVPFPPFHMAGFLNNIMVPIFTNTIPIFGPATRLPSGGLVAQVLRCLNVKGCFLPPMTVADLYNEPDGPELLKSLDILCYAGGPLPESIGNELIQHVALCQFFGSTETGQIRQLFPLKEDWQYIEFHPSENIELQKAGENTFELVIHASDETENFSLLNHNFPGVREYRTKDLFLPHPNKPGLWKFYSRRDDIIVLATGEKLNPVPLELGVQAIPGVAGALVAGESQARVALLVELQPDHNLGPNPEDTLWPSIRHLNSDIAGPGRVSRSMIFIAKDDKPFIRAGKGTVVRKLTLEAYQEELNNLFRGSPKQPVQPVQSFLLKPTAFRLDDVKALIRSIIENVLDGVAVDDSSNLYTQGLDSVKSLETVTQLKAALESLNLGKPSTWITLEMIYTYSSINELATVLLSWLNEGTYPENIDRVSRTRDLLSHYEQSLPVGSSALESGETNFQEQMNVVLIGSTGYLGQYMLLLLAQDPRIGRIICLNRSATAHKTWATHPSTEQLFKNKEWQDKIHFFQIDFTQPRFGLADKVYSDLNNECDVILHSAWQVNFVLPVGSFKDSFSGLMNTIQLAANSKRCPRIFFISSVSASGIFSPQSSAEAKLVPEGRITDPNEAMQTGYGESKHVAENLLCIASAKSKVTTSILRVGQIAPPTATTGEIIWAEKDALTGLLETSKSLQMVPSDLMDIDWLPVNSVAEIVNSLLHQDRHSKEAILFHNLVHPAPMPWSEAVPVIQSWCGQSAGAAPLKDWIAAVKAREKEEQDSLQVLPSLPLLSFFDLLSDRGPSHKYSQQNLLGGGHTNHIKSIDANQIRLWLDALS
ncbi:NRPS-like enzyme, putative [Talaromyces stipitatus ATCC 10500]|uniref:NRPS-like enzyme, putative n=1 Tax=Talaromyces stipitatus (strain ATCC 10500 / CBS 375.48 / QM 6759 / NRRL 1006) TaxID=441959 RepID=B8M144_TALSN|nr:NRPS-like enzyme, putative [Talaromyces stipitatus ATCC 10500]EED20986.1 NRPS-like enzyme, putative [Talaromyces stipitatus ATCC 10500]